MTRRKVTTVLISGALLTAMVACEAPPEQRADEAPVVDTTAIMATFKDSLPRRFEAAVQAGDFEAQASIYTEDALYSHPMATPVRGRDSIRALFERVTPPGATADIESIDTGILGPDRVYDFGTVTFSFRPEGVDELVTMTNTYFALFERTNEGWKITREALSANHPPPGNQ